MKIKVSNSILWIIVSLLLSFAVTGCKKTSGGGWIPVDGGNSKATFGYQASCANIAHPSNPDLFVGQVTGQFQYKDHGSNVAFHAVIDSIPYNIDPAVTSCEGMAVLLAELDDQGFGYALNSFGMMGTYTPIPKNAGPGGQVTIGVADNIAVICDAGDAVSVVLNGGVYDGYTKSGCLAGGNLTVFSE